MSQRKPFEPLTPNAIDAFQVFHTEARTKVLMDMRGEPELLEVVNAAIESDRQHYECVRIKWGEAIIEVRAQAEAQFALYAARINNLVAELK